MTRAAAPGPAVRPRQMRRLVVLALGLALVALLLALGSWQLQRRSWKLALIDRVQARVHAAPEPAPGPATWPHIDAQGYEYRHVQLSGVWLHARSAWVVAATELGSGYWLMTPLQQTDGSVVWVNRGFVSPAARAHWHAPDAPGPAQVTGLLRLSEADNRWPRHNDPVTERWYARDLPVLSAQRHLGPTAPYFVDADAAPVADASAPERPEPVGGLTVVQFANNHLAYALTWFTLAVLAAWGTRLFWRAAAAPEHSGDNTQLD